MPKTFCCEICCFETTKKSTYTDHLTSKKHLNKSSGLTSVSSDASTTSLSTISNCDTNSSTASRIRELEHQLQLKDLEIQRIKNEYEMKLQHKDEIIALLKQQPAVKPEPPKNNVELLVQEKPQPSKKSKPSISIKETLEKNRQQAPAIESCIQLIYDSDYNSFIQDAVVNDQEYILLHPSKLKQSEFKSRGIDNAIDILSKFFNALPKEQLPFYCSDKRRNTLYLKTIDGWIKQTETNQEDIDKILLTLIMNALNSIQRAVSNMWTLFRKNQQKFRQIYDLAYDDWDYNHRNEIISVLNLVGNETSARAESNEEKENKRLAIKHLKIMLSQMSDTIKGYETDDSN